jgi:hypothetical protein
MRLAADTARTFPGRAHAMPSPPSTGCARPSGSSSGRSIPKGRAHAQLTFDNGMIMLASAGNPSEWGRRIALPDEIGMRETRAHA